MSTEKPLKPLWWTAGHWWRMWDGTVERWTGTAWTSASAAVRAATAMDCHLYDGKLTWYGGNQMGRLVHNAGEWDVEIAATTVPTIANQKNAGGHLVVDSQGRTWGFGGPTGEVRYFVRDTDLTELQGDTLLTSDPSTSEHVSRSVVWDGKVGVLWDNQTTDRMRFVYRNDADSLTTWQTIENASSDAFAGNADDHGDITPGPDGDLLAVWKTEATSSDPVIMYARRTSAGAWVDETAVWFPYGSGSNEHTRPRIVYDAAADEVVVLATRNFNGGPIEYRRSPRLDPTFGDEQTAISGTTNNITVPHHEATSASGLLVMDESGGVGVVTAAVSPVLLAGRFVRRDGELVATETGVVRDGMFVAS